MYGIVVNGISSGTSTDGYALRPLPNYWKTNTTFLQTVTIAPTQKVVSIEAFHQLVGSSYFLTKMKFVMDDGTSQTVTATNYGLSLSSYIPTPHPYSKEFSVSIVGVR